VESRHLQGCSTCLSRLRTDGLALRVSIERKDRMLVFMGPVRLVVGCQQKFGFSLLLQWLVRERSWVRTCGSLSWAGGCVGSPSSWEQWICSNLLMIVRKLAICGPCEIRIVLNHTRTERGKRVECWSGFPL
jgi:hypothetical protein